MSLTQSMLGIALGLIVSLVAISQVRRLASLRSGQSRARDFHHGSGPVPRLGGIGLALAFGLLAVVAFATLQPQPGRTGLWLAIVAGSLAMFAVGFWDDLRALGARKKLLLQILVASAVYAAGLRIELCRLPWSGEVLDLGIWSAPVTVLWLIAFTNLINLIDGIDGLAGGISLMLLALLAYVTASVSSFSFFLSLGMAGAVMGFLYYNFPPARIYMGDGGAYLLGFLIAALSLKGSQKGAVAAALIAPVVALGIPIIDTALAILRRGLKGLPIFRPDRQHIHHRLLAGGMSRRRAVVSLYVMSLVCVAMAFGAYLLQHRFIPMLIGIGFLCLILTARRCGLLQNLPALKQQLEDSWRLRGETRYALALAAWFELDAERAGSPGELWDTFKIVVSKLGFSHVELQSPGGTRFWQANGITLEHPSLRHCRIRLDASGETRLHFAADSAHVPPHLFEHLAELAAESWHKASRQYAEGTTVRPRLPAGALKRPIAAH